MARRQRSVSRCRSSYLMKRRRASHSPRATASCVRRCSRMYSRQDRACPRTQTSHESSASGCFWKYSGSRSNAAVKSRIAERNGSSGGPPRRRLWNVQLTSTSRPSRIMTMCRHPGRSGSIRYGVWSPSHSAVGLSSARDASDIRTIWLIRSLARDRSGSREPRDHDSLVKRLTARARISKWNSPCTLIRGCRFSSRPHQFVPERMWPRRKNIRQTRPSGRTTVSVPIA